MPALGTIFVELSLDDKVFKQKLSEELKSTEATAKGIERVWKHLGDSSDAQYEAQARSYQNAMKLIESSANKTANDIYRAQYAMHEKINALNAQREKSSYGVLGIRSTSAIEAQKAQIIAAYGQLTSQVKKGSQDWANIENAKNAKIKELNREMVGDHERSLASMTRAVLRFYAAWYVATASLPYISAPFEKGFKAVEEYSQSVASLGAMVVTFSKRQEGMGLSDQWKEALAYSKQMVPVLEEIAARTLLSGQETVALANAFARSGVFLDGTNEKQIESFTRISNALPLMTQGQEIMRQINTEIRSLMTGSNEQSSMMLTTLKAIDPEIESHLKIWRAEGTVLEHIGELLVGFGPATAELENQWTAVKSTIDTTATQVLRGLMKPAYDEIILKTKELNAYLVKNKEAILQWGKEVTERFKLMNREVDKFRLLFKLLTMGSPWKPEKEWEAGIGRQPRPAPQGITPTDTTKPDAAASKAAAAAKKAADEYARLIEQAIKFREKAGEDIELSGLEGLRKELRKNEIDAENAKEQFAGLKGKQRELTFAAIGQIEAMKNRLAVSKETEAQRKLAVNGVKEETEAIIKLRKEEEDAAKEAARRAKEKLQAERDIYQDLREYSGEFYAATKQMIEDQAAAYRELGISEVAVSKWVAEELYKAEIVKLRASDKFYDGWKAGLMQMKHDALTWAEAGEGMFKSFAENSQSTLSNVFFDGFKGQLKSFTDYWQSFTDALLKKFADICAQMLVEWMTTKAAMSASNGISSLASAGISLVSGFFGSGTSATAEATMARYHSGGMVGSEPSFFGSVPALAFAGAPRFHSGLASDEFPAILQKGESVFTKGQIKALGDVINARNQSSTSISVPINMPFRNPSMASDMRSEIESTVERVIRRYS